MEKDGRDGSNKLFGKFHEIMDKQGLLAKEGSTINANFVEAPKQRNNRNENKKIKVGERPEGFEKGSSEFETYLKNATCRRFS